MLLPRGEIADGLLGGRGCVGGGNQVARRPARGLSSPFWSMDGLDPTSAELEPCVLHHGFRKRRKLKLACGGDGAAAFLPLQAAATAFGCPAGAASRPLCLVSLTGPFASSFAP